MQDNFRTAKQTIRTSNSKLHVVAVNGCCYGREAKPDKGDYFKYCGQKFWNFISGDPDLYLIIVNNLSYSVKEKNEKFDNLYAKIINMFTLEFGKTFVTDGEINWPALVKFNSSDNQ